MSLLTLAIVGNPDDTHVGAHFERAARTLGTSTTFVDVRDAFSGPAWRRQLDWRLRGRSMSESKISHFRSIAALPRCSHVDTRSACVVDSAEAKWVER